MVVLNFQSADEIPWYDNSTETSSSVLLHGTICFSIFCQMFSNSDVWHAWEFKILRIKDPTWRLTISNRQTNNTETDKTKNLSTSFPHAVAWTEDIWVYKNYTDNSADLQQHQNDYQVKHKADKLCAQALLLVYINKLISQVVYYLIANIRMFLDFGGTMNQ